MDFGKSAKADYGDKTMATEIRASERKLRRIDQLLREHTELKAGGVRDQIFKSAENGLDAAGAVIRVVKPGAKRGIVYVDVDRYFEWLTSRCAA